MNPILFFSTGLSLFPSSTIEEATFDFIWFLNCFSNMYLQYLMIAFIIERYIWCLNSFFPIPFPFLQHSCPSIYKCFASFSPSIVFYWNPFSLPFHTASHSLVLIPIWSYILDSFEDQVREFTVMFSPLLNFIATAASHCSAQVSSEIYILLCFLTDLFHVFIWTWSTTLKYFMGKSLCGIWLRQILSVCGSHTFSFVFILFL